MEFLSLFLETKLLHWKLLGVRLPPAISRQTGKLRENLIKNTLLLLHHLQNMSQSRLVSNLIDQIVLIGTCGTFLFLINFLLEVFLFVDDVSGKGAPRHRLKAARRYNGEEKSAAIMGFKRITTHLQGII